MLPFLASELNQEWPHHAVLARSQDLRLEQERGRNDLMPRDVITARVHVQPKQRSASFVQALCAEAVVAIFARSNFLKRRGLAAQHRFVKLEGEKACKAITSSSKPVLRNEIQQLRRRPRHNVADNFSRRGLRHGLREVRLCDGRTLKRLSRLRRLTIRCHLSCCRLEHAICRLLRLRCFLQSSRQNRSSMQNLFDESLRMSML